MTKHDKEILVSMVSGGRNTAAEIKRAPIAKSIDDAMLYVISSGRSYDDWLLIPDPPKRFSREDVPHYDDADTFVLSEHGQDILDEYRDRLWSKDMASKNLFAARCTLMLTAIGIALSIVGLLCTILLR